MTMARYGALHDEWAQSPKVDWLAAGYLKYRRPRRRGREPRIRPITPELAAILHGNAPAPSLRSGDHGNLAGLARAFGLKPGDRRKAFI